MSDPTPAQINADITRPTYEVQVYNSGSGTWSSVVADVERVGHAQELTGSIGGFAFGTGRRLAAEITIDQALFGTAWQGRRVRIGYGFESSNRVIRFVGVITGRSRGRRSGAWRVGGLDTIIGNEKVWSPLFTKRAPFTRTSATSVENPASAGYRGGIGNYLAWTLGGRPLEQQASYPNALFYYSFEQSVLAPKYTWTAGENLWNELDRLCQSCGGQVFQDNSGTLRYVGPLGLATGLPVYTLTDAPLTAAQRSEQNAIPYGDVSEDSDLKQVTTGVSCVFTERLLQGTQTIYDKQDPLPAPLRGGETATIQCDTQWPIFDAGRVAVTVEAAIGRTLAKPSAAQLVVTITDRKATRFAVQLTNTLGEPIQIYRVKLAGRPITAAEPGSAFFSASGALDTAKTMEIPESPLIQSASHARRLCRMIWDFHGGDRGRIRLSDVPYHPYLQLGAPVYFTSVDWEETNTVCRVVALRPAGDGFMEVELGRAAGLPVRDEFYIIGQTYSAADVRQLCY